LEKHLLEIEGIDVYYGDVQALYDVSLTVDQGSIVALVGANGAGKSTLLKTISRLTRLKGGTITFDGKPLSGKKPEAVVGMGISHVPEGRGLFSELTVLENLKLGAYPSQARRNVNESLDRCYQLFPILQDRIEQKAGSLSGGEQQMLAIARGLMSQPKILMLDEPSLGLSPILVRTMFELIAELNEQQVTILLVEQNIHQALKIAHHAYVMKTGKIVMQGPGNELLCDPEVQNAYIGERWSQKTC
jgi:branched-chain amino acid transport system ATP-binding protein